MRQLVISIVLIGLFTCCKNENSKKQNAPEPGMFTLIGEVDGIENGIIYLSKGNDKKEIKVTNGGFTYSDSITQPVERRSLYLDKPNDSSKSDANLYLEPSAMHLYINTGDRGHIKLSGSKSQDEEYLFQEMNSDLENKYESFLDSSELLYSSLDSLENKQKPDAKKLAIVNRSLDSIEKNLEPYYEELDSLRSHFIKSRPNSYVALSKLHEGVSYSFDFEEVSGLFNNFSDSLKNTDIGKETHTILEGLRKSAIGRTAQDFSTIDSNGEQLRLADFRGKYVLLDFWATWCKPCRAGNPHLIKIHEKYNSKGFEIIGIADDEKRQTAWREAIDKDKIGIWRHTLRGKFDASQTDLATLYAVNAYPTKILIDPEGKIILNSIGSGKDEEDAMDLLFEELFKE